MNVPVYDNRIEETFDYKINCLQQINDNHPYILIAPTQNSRKPIDFAWDTCSVRRQQNDSATINRTLKATFHAFRL